MQGNAVYADHEQIKIQHVADVLRHIPFMCVTPLGRYNWYKFAVFVTIADSQRHDGIWNDLYTRLL